MESKYLIDSNVIIDYLANNLPESSALFMDNIIRDLPVLSVISKIEILGYPTSDAINQILIDFIDHSKIIDLDDQIVKKTIYLRKNTKIKLPDAIIAATALVKNMILLTRNTEDFKSIQELQIKNPWLI